MKRIGLGLALFIATTVMVVAQTSKVNNVVSMNINNIQPIKSGEKIKGYYMFYKADKVKGGEYSYKIRILDENAQKVAEKKVVASNLFYLLEAQYNESLLCFKFYDLKEKKIKLIFYNDKAENVYSKSYEVSKMEKKMISMRVSQGLDNSAPTLFPIEGSGFLDVTSVKNDKIGYEINFFPNDKTQQKWKYGSKKTSPLLEFASVLESNKDVVVLLVGLKKGLMSKEAEYKIVTLDSKTGKEIYDMKVSSPKYEESITNIYYDANKKQVTLFGYYFPKGSNVVSDPSLGIMITTLDAKGKRIEQKYNSWTKDIAKYLGPSKKGKIDEIGFIFFHKFVRKADGSFYGIGESFRKTVSAGGVALKALAAAGGGGSGTSAFQISVKDFYIFEFAEDKSIKGVEVIEKSISRVSMPNGAGFYSPQVLALLVKAYGGFDYSYLKMLNNDKTFAVFYTDYERIKGEKNKSVCGVVSHTDGEYLVDKINLPTESDYVRILPAQDGNVIFVEYFIKEKDLTMEFKKMNY